VRIGNHYTAEDFLVNFRGDFLEFFLDLKGTVWIGFIRRLIRGATLVQ
jgi:hypothetical protein